MNAASDKQERWIGPDLVRIEAGALVIYSSRDMPDWSVREFSQPVIWFQEQKFFLCGKESIAGPRRWRYVLSLWPEHERQPPPYAIFYCEEYVAQREQACRLAFAFASGRCLLLPFYPLLGFLWSGLKDRLVPCGFGPRSMTSLSLGIQFGAFVIFGTSIGYLGFWSVRNVLLLVALGLDLLMRYDFLLRDHPREFGFAEWCFRR
jgi:hypothetical protein